MGLTGYIVDKTNAETLVLYSIRPSSGSVKLNVVDVKGNVPSFIPGRVATVRGTQIILFGGMIGGHTPSADFYIYDTVTSTWSGPKLVNQPPLPTPTKISRDGNNHATNTPQIHPTSSTTNIGAIVGGVVGGLVFFALVGILLFRRKRKNKDDGAESVKLNQIHSNPDIQTAPSDFPVSTAYPTHVPEHPTVPVSVVSVNGAQSLIYQPHPGVPQAQPHYYEPPTLVQAIPYYAPTDTVTTVGYGSPTSPPINQAHLPLIGTENSPSFKGSPGAPQYRP
ncbi:hypothetical protein BGW41_003536 [Actinomortierella wolfii]|nr:hypothetical protein BGW41_003536 [Actinomortierella wolfii]